MTKTTVLKSISTKKILAVDDDGEIGLVLEMILNDKEYQLDYVNSILSADEYLGRYKPDLIVLDNKLPDGFGVDFISYIRKKHPSIKIIMISGFSSVRDVALENGAHAFLEKPFSLDDFNDTVNRLLH
jgi:two-component system, OmpR family, response regulator